MIRPTTLALAALAAAALCGCADHTDSPTDAPSVVLYTSADDVFVAQVVGAFEAETGIAVRLVGDTEATKTTGLVTRILAEKDNPRCDVWWSSEPMGTLLLDESGVLAPGGMDGLVSEDWPAELVGPGANWIGFAERARVIAYSTDRVETPPTTLAELTEPEWKGRVGIAHPAFGTTRGHMALLLDRWGEANFTAWLEAMKANGIRLYDGNARAVRAIHEGEIDVCLTDTDDVWVAIANGWEIGMVFESEAEHDRWPSRGATTIPNTVAIVRGGPNPQAARTLAAFLVSPTVERLLAESDSRNIPVDAGLRAEFSELLPPGDPPRPDYAGAHDAVSGAMDACERVLISP
ncbi:MAG: extracellular solute-binding protein [Planctomycetota bacterium]|nr:MAG: extracellular solute-binding protein [Planctomycetota bacterium]